MFGEGERGKETGGGKRGSLNSKKNRLKFISPYCKEVYPATTTHGVTRLTVFPKSEYNFE